MQETPAHAWTFPEKLVFRFSFVFVLLFICFSVLARFFADSGILHPFESFAHFTGTHIFGIRENATWEFISDSTGFYVHVVNLFFIALIAAAAWSFFDRRRANYRIAAYWFFVVVRYYLALELIIYGYIKAFKWQFYLPEPNTLFTTLAGTPRDLLYWSAMGTSRSYVMFMAVAEIVAALLLLFRRTKTFGALLAAGILVNVLMVNIGFDISVKLFSSFLLLLSLVLLAPDLRQLFRFFSGQPAQLQQWTPDVSGRYRWPYVSSKVLVLLFILGVPLLAYMKSGNFNDDTAARPPLHGAYEARSFVRNGQPVPADDASRWKRVFVHRQGYFITQNMREEMTDYPVRIDTAAKKFSIEDREGKVVTFAYTAPNDSVLIVTGVLGNDTLSVLLEKIDLEKLPLMQEEFSWTVD